MRIASVLLTAIILAGCLSCAGGEPQSDCGTAPAGFRHGVGDVGTTRLHYLIGGAGPPVLLIHGFPATWWTWRKVMPELAAAHTVLVPDLGGVGCSDLGGPYDAASSARELHTLVRRLGLGPVALVGHDVGGWVSYSYARLFRAEVTHLVLSGAAIPGFGLEKLLDFRTPGPGLPHLAFFMQPDIPELLIGGREREYFSRFITSDTVRDDGALDVYAASYARPGRLTAALGRYRSLYHDAADNRAGAGPLLTMPTLAIGGSDPALAADSLRQVADHVTETAIAGTGHWAHEERPADFAAAVDEFLDPR